MTNEERIKEINEKIQELKNEEISLMRERDECNKAINKVMASIVGKCYRNENGCYLITGVPPTCCFNQFPCVTINFNDECIDNSDELYVNGAGRCKTEEELINLMRLKFEEITHQQFRDEALELVNSLLKESWTKRKEYEFALR